MLKEILKKLHLGELNVDEAEREIDSHVERCLDITLNKISQDYSRKRAEYLSKFSTLEIKMKECWNAYVELRKEYLKKGE